MKTNIEKLLLDNREELDIESPPKDAWNAIRGELPSNKPDRSIQWWKVAAALFLVSTLGLIAYNFTLQERVDELASLGDISDHYKQVETDYQREINQLTGNSSLEEALQTEDLKWMKDELTALEEVNRQYRSDIGTEADTELLVEALVDYYEKKIRLLKKLELEINRRKNEKSNSDRASIS